MTASYDIAAMRPFSASSMLHTLRTPHWRPVDCRGRKDMIEKSKGALAQPCCCVKNCFAVHIFRSVAYHAPSPLSIVMSYTNVHRYKPASHSFSLLTAFSPVNGAHSRRARFSRNFAFGSPCFTITFRFHHTGPVMCCRRRKVETGKSCSGHVLGVALHAGLRLPIPTARTCANPVICRAVKNARRSL